MLPRFYTRDGTDQKKTSFIGHRLVNSERLRPAAVVELEHSCLISGYGYPFKIDGEVKDALTHLGRLESSFERVHERLENIEDRMEQVTRHRLPSKRLTKSKPAAIAARMMRCKICHLLSTSPIAMARDTCQNKNNHELGVMVFGLGVGVFCIRGRGFLH